MAETYHELQADVLRFIQKSEGSFSALAQRIHAFQFTGNLPYRAFCHLRGVGNEIENWTQIPAVPQHAFKVSRVATFPESETVREFRTSGTTGEGYGCHFFRDLTLYEAAIPAGWQLLDIDHLPKFVLTPSPLEALHSSLSFMMSRLVKNESSSFYMSGGCLDEPRLRRDIATTDSPVLILGTALALFHLMETGSAPLTLPPGSHILETGGYKGSGRTLTKSAFYQQLSAFFDVSESNVINEYGMTELSSQFYARGLDTLHRSGDWIRARVVHPISREEVRVGEVGILQLFDLANVGSVLAIQTEDLAMKEDSGFRLIGRDPAAAARGCSRNADDQLNGWTRIICAA